ncbi:winged helix-turn-helix domain-containing protein [Mycobacterium sp. 1164985.4]|uniref:winged helix-turn-helix domain-containing protein n=1 Tax=Mycobacterium sp. 1164985.4 TaxID=1834069 RepID=UPI000801F981|nr:winged helix-turn-helix domain-containing protein [Mycobacterium sp. 1164985.4]OBK73894.1 transcriptional regulator [Mycobacterium sp. 1164985.4]
MYQSASQRQGPPAAELHVVLVFDIPDDSPVSADRTAYLADEYGRLIATSIPGVRVREAVITRASTSRHRPRPATGLSIDRTAREVRVDGQCVRMTYREFELLCHFASRPGAVVSRDELIAQVWHDWAPGDSRRTVDTHIRRIRAKLGRFAGVLTTIRGRGYRFDPGPEVYVAA